VGTRTLSDVLDAELDLFRSEAGQVNSQIGAIEAVLNLEMATGRSIYSFN
jgi:outer membrane protein TolC